MRVVTVLHVFQGDAYVTATAGYAGGYRFGIGDDGVDKLIDIFRVVADVFVGNTFGSARVDADLRTVFQRRHFRRDMVPKKADNENGCRSERKCNPAFAQEGCQRTAVKVIQSFKERFGLTVEPALLLSLYQQLGSQHRRKGQCGKRGDDDRTGYYDTELTEQTSRHTVHKYDGKEYRYQRNGGRDYGKEDFFGSLDTGLFRGHSFFDADVDVLRHYNGIINHKSHGKYNGKHGEYVDGESCQVHNEECSD